MAEQAYDEFPEDGAPTPQRRVFRPLPLILALVVIAVFFAAVAWYALSNGGGNGGQHIAAFEPPLLKAEEGPYKRKPEDPGGMQIPNQDKLVYERILPGPAPQKTEQLLPKPEEPMARPEPEKPMEPPASALSPDTNKPPLAGSAADAPSHPLPPSATAEADTAQSAGAEAKDADDDAAQVTPAAAADQAENEEKPDSGAARIAADGTPMPSEKPLKIAALVAATPPASSREAEAGTAQVSADLAASYRLQLAAFRDEEHAMTAWRRLREKFPGELSNLKPMLERVEITGKGVFHRLQAGPFVSAAAAEAGCDALKAKKQDCLIVRPN